MFGYVTVYKEALNEADIERYKAYYCGLCRTIGKNHGNFSCTTLTYDMTFLTILLSKIYYGDTKSGMESCLIHPIKKHKYIVCGDVSDYTAAMNVALAYYKCLDDWHDDKKVLKGSEAFLLRREFKKISQKYPEKCRLIKQCIDKLSEMEKSGEMNPDLPAHCFGDMLGELFVYKDDVNKEALRSLGCNLGKFIYIVDACCDLKTDLRKEKYNPMVSIKKENHREILNMLSDMCIDSFLSIKPACDDELLKNIMYSGIWLKYMYTQSKEQKENEVKDE